MSQKLDRNHYFPRIVDQVIQHKLSYAGAIELRGPKWCGKTQSALQHAASSLMMQDPDKKKDYLLLADTKPSILLKGPTPRLIDEWQEAPQLWDAVRFSVDQSSKPGLFLLTGSSTPTSLPSHSGAGRIASIDMGPMSLTESRDSTAEVSLEALFNGEVDCFGHSECDIEDMAYLICRGGWPRAVTTSKKRAALEMAFDYVTTIAEQDIDTVDHPEGSQSARHRPVERYREWLSRSPEKAVCYPGTFCMDTHFARQIAHHENADSSLRLPLHRRRCAWSKPRVAFARHRDHGPVIRVTLRSRPTCICAGEQR